MSALMLVAALAAASASGSGAVDRARPVIVRDAEVARPTPTGPHQGLGPSIGHPFSETAHSAPLYFSKRILKPGATVGKHLVDMNEVYYLVEGEADLIDDAGSRHVAAGSALFLFPGQTVELRQSGPADVVMIIANAPPR